MLKLIQSEIEVIFFKINSLNATETSDIKKCISQGLCKSTEWKHRLKTDFFQLGSLLKYLVSGHSGLSP